MTADDPRPAGEAVPTSTYVDGTIYGPLCACGSPWYAHRHGVASNTSRLAPPVSQADGDRELDTLDELAYVLHGQGYCGEVCVCVDDARALLPVVRALVAEGAAKELRAAANSLEVDYAPDSVLDWLTDTYARADALDPP